MTALPNVTARCREILDFLRPAVMTAAQWESVQLAQILRFYREQKAQELWKKILIDKLPRLEDRGEAAIMEGIEPDEFRTALEVAYGYFNDWLDHPSPLTQKLLESAADDLECIIVNMELTKERILEKERRQKQHDQRQKNTEGIKT